MRRAALWLGWLIAIYFEREEDAFQCNLGLLLHPTSFYAVYKIVCSVNLNRHKICIFCFKGHSFGTRRVFIFETSQFSRNVYRCLDFSVTTNFISPLLEVKILDMLYRGVLELSHSACGLNPVVYSILEGL